MKEPNNRYASDNTASQRIFILLFSRVHCAAVFVALRFALNHNMAGYMMGDGDDNQIFRQRKLINCALFIMLSGLTIHSFAHSVVRFRIFSPFLPAPRRQCEAPPVCAFRLQTFLWWLRLNRCGCSPLIGKIFIFGVIYRNPRRLNRVRDAIKLTHFETNLRTKIRRLFQSIKL